MKYLFLTILSCVLLSCQSGRTDKKLFSTSNTSSPSSLSNSLENTKLEIPTYSNDDIILNRIAYTSCYDRVNKIPKWVAWHLTAEHCSGEQRRLSNFIVDENVPAPRAELIDYKGSGYDRGHMCPAGDNKWGFEPMRESFYLTNICPQNHNLNSGDWNELEIACRKWAEKYGDIYIVAGPILYKNTHTTIGPNKVRVPEAFFKVVLCMVEKPKAIGFIYKNTNCNNPKSSYVNTIDEVERITGLDFFPSLPDEIENAVEATASYDLW